MYQETLAVSGGTCFLDASSNDTQVVQILQHPGKALCSQLILGARGLGTATVTIQDIGLSPRALTDSLVLSSQFSQCSTFYLCETSAFYLFLLLAMFGLVITAVDLPRAMSCPVVHLIFIL